jgi:hypothetical protein
LREVGVPEPATLLIPCFKAGISDMLKQQVLPLLNQSQFDHDFEALAQEFTRTTVGMKGIYGFHAYGNVGQANTAQGGRPPAKKAKWQEQRTCFVCGKKGHVARICPNRQTNEEAKAKGPVVLSFQGTASNSVNSDDVLLFDSGATHHIVRDATYLRNMVSSKISKIALGGGETQQVVGEGELLIHSPQTGHD